MSTRWYVYHQNNSGGDFYHDPEAGIGYEVFIEAESAAEADRRAEDIGIYFNGVAYGPDCDCCGDRWYQANPYCKTNADKIDGYSVLSAPPNSTDRFWGLSSYAHPLNGKFYEIKEG